MSEWLSTNAWIFGYVATFLLGMATVMSWRIYCTFKEDRLLAKEQRLLEKGPRYDADADVERITEGWDLPRPVSPGSVTVIAPSPMLREPSGGYATVGLPRPSVRDRYATLQWLDAPVYKGRAVVVNGGRHRVENVFTTEIDLKAVMERIEMENEWQASSTGRLALSAGSYGMAQ